MDWPTMGICIAGMGVIAPFAYRLLPERTKKPVLTEADLEALDARVKLYQRMQTVENNQVHQGDMIKSLTTDFSTTSTLLFQKIDAIKDLLIREHRE